MRSQSRSRSGDTNSSFGGIDWEEVCRKKRKVESSKKITDFFKEKNERKSLLNKSVALDENYKCRFNLSAFILNKYQGTVVLQNSWYKFVWRLNKRKVNSILKPYSSVFPANAKSLIKLFEEALDPRDHDFKDIDISPNFISLSKIPESTSPGEKWECERRIERFQSILSTNFHMYPHYNELRKVCTPIPTQEDDLLFFIVSLKYTLLHRIRLFFVFENFTEIPEIKNLFLDSSCGGDIIFRILEFFTSTDIFLSFASVCRKLNEFCTSEFLFQRLCIRDFGIKKIPETQSTQQNNSNEQRKWRDFYKKHYHRTRKEVQKIYSNTQEVVLKSPKQTRRNSKKKRRKSQKGTLNSFFKVKKKTEDDKRKKKKKTSNSSLSSMTSSTSSSMSHDFMNHSGAETRSSSSQSSSKKKKKKKKTKKKKKKSKKKKSSQHTLINFEQQLLKKKKKKKKGKGSGV